ncbi:MAG: hypothetical protein COA86_06420 [Kangiella sp.]|nr:MAG: hypothetical protein COA86_06420 [Kangiella sp.]
MKLVSHLKLTHNKWLIIALLFVFCNISFANVSEENAPIENEQAKPLKISILEENSPYSLQLPNGQLIGYYVDFWQLWAKTNNINIEFVVGTYDQNISALKSKKVDFHSGLFATDNRDLWADYSIPFDRINTTLFYLNSQKLSINKILDTKGLKVAIQPYSAQASELPKQYPEIDFTPIDSFDELINQLISGELDVIIGEVYPLKNAFRKIGAQSIVAQAKLSVTSNNVYALVPKGNKKLVTKINNGIRAMARSELSELANKWLPNQNSMYFNKRIDSSIGLTQSERYWLDSLGDLKIGIGKFWKPIEFLNEDQQLQGISSDYISRLKSDLGLYLESDYRLTWAEVNDRVKSGDIDILTAVGITDKRREYLNFTAPYLQIPMVIVVKKNGIFIQKPEDLLGYSVGASQSNPINDIWSKQYPNIVLQPTRSSSHGLQAVQDGELDAFIANLITIGPKIKDTYTELEVVAITPYNIDVAFGVRKGLEDLVPILNKWLKSIPAEDKLDIQNVWMSSELKQGKNFFDYALQWSPLVFLGLLIAGFIIKKNIDLSKNIKKRIEVERRLENAKEASEIANRNKEQFLANMSHEVRTPINALVGTAHLLEQSGLDKPQLDYIESINYSANSLLLLVDDISDFTKVESGILSLDSSSFNLNTLLKNVFSQAKVNLSYSEDSSDNIAIEHHISLDIPSDLLGDSHRLGQIITNLLSNAIKFTKEGAIILKVSTENPMGLPIIENKTTLTFELQDSGIGMTEPQQNRLFQAYSQTDSSIAREYGGTGLGLAICKKLCTLMDGDIKVESEIDKGSKFIFTVQLEKAINQSSEKKSKANENTVTDDRSLEEIKSILNEKEILLVDDNLVNLMIAKKILNGYDVNVTTAENGKKAVELASEDKFDLILMDIQMPEMDGYQATKIIRETLQLKLPIIALSANVMENDKRLSKLSGMDDHLAKPIKVDEMIKTLASFLN